MDFNFCQKQVDELKQIITSIQDDIDSHNPCFKHKVSNLKHVIKTLDDVAVSDVCCYYSGNSYIHDCLGNSKLNVRMFGKNSPKYRNVCVNCFAYLVSNDLAQPSTN